MGMPTGASSNIPMGRRFAWVIKPLTTRFVEVLIRVTELVRMEENESGMSSLEGLILGALGKANDEGNKERCGGGVADKKAEPREHTHDDRDEAKRVIAGVLAESCG